MKRHELRRLIQRSELNAALLRQPDAPSLSPEQMERIADDYDAWAALGRRVFGTELLERQPTYAQPCSVDGAA